MILRPGFCYTFLRIDRVKYDQEQNDPNNKYPYFGEILSDSWGPDGHPKNRLLWDEDWNSGDYWQYDELYPELIDYVNTYILENFIVQVNEFVKDSNIKQNIYIIDGLHERVIKDYLCPTRNPIDQSRWDEWPNT